MTSNAHRHQRLRDALVAAIEALGQYERTVLTVGATVRIVARGSTNWGEGTITEVSDDLFFEDSVWVRLANAPQLAPRRYKTSDVLFVA